MRFSPHLPRIYSIPVLTDILGLPSRFRIQFADASFSSTQLKSNRVLVQAESGQTGKVTRIKVEANDFQQANRLHRVHGDHSHKG